MYSLCKKRKENHSRFNLDLLRMKHRINADSKHVFIEIWDDGNGWLPLFGINNRCDFVGMPTCRPVVSIVYDAEENAAYWCENRQWHNISKQQFGI